MLSLMSNNAQLKRFLQMALVGPEMPRLVELAEESGETGAKKRLIVINSAVSWVNRLIPRNLAPAEALEGLEKLVGELVDLRVAEYNDKGYFAHVDEKTKAATASTAARAESKEKVAK